MTTTLSRAWLAGLVAVAITLLGYSAWAWRAQVRDLQSQVAQANARIMAAETALTQVGIPFFGTLQSADVADVLDAMVVEPLQSARRGLLNQIETQIFDQFAIYGVAAEVVLRLEDLVLAETEADRQDIRNRLGAKIDAMAPEFGGPEPFVDGQTATTLSTLVTAFGGLVSALSALVLFLTGGSRRNLEHDLLSVDLELKRVALAKAQYDARDALNAQQGG